MSKIIKKIDGKDYELTFQEVKVVFGKKEKHSRWMALEKNEKGEYDFLDYVCKIPEGCNDIDLATLNTDCLTNNIPPNKEALV